MTSALMGATGTRATGTPVVSFENVRKTYGKVRAVDGLTMELRPGETVAFLGAHRYHAIKSGRVGAMLQSGGLMPEITVRDLIALVTSFHPRPEPVEQTM